MVSAIILAYNRRAEALVTINRLNQLKAAAPFDIEIILVDNASQDGISETVKKVHTDIKLVTRNTNNGVAGWNDGFAIAKHPFLLVLDDDSHVENGLTEAVEFMQQRPGVGILGFNIVDEALQGDPLLDPELAWKHLQHIMGFIGCGALIRKEVYEKIGGFAEWLFIYTHEFDYSIRALQAGYQTLFYERVNVVHRTSKLNRTNKRLRIYATRNELAIVYKYFGSQKAKYLFRTLINNLKFIRREGLMAGYYILLGAKAFLKIRKQITPTPVSKQVQDFYAENFWSTKPV